MSLKQNQKILIKKHASPHKEELQDDVKFKKL